MGICWFTILLLLWHMWDEAKERRMIQKQNELTRAQVKQELMEERERVRDRLEKHLEKVGG